MIIIYILLIALGALPMIRFVVKRKHYRKVLSEGTSTTAEVKHVIRRRMYKGTNNDKVVFWYLPNGANQYREGQLTTKPGKYRGGNTLEVYYLPGQPEKYALPGNKYETLTIVFLILFFAFVVFACFKIDQLVRKNNATYEFKPPWTK